jgi:hypothetical protein
VATPASAARVAVARIHNRPLSRARTYRASAINENDSAGTSVMKVPDIKRK